MKQPEVAILKKKNKKNNRYPILGIFLACFLFGALVLLGERIMFDLNRVFNPAVDSEYTQWKNDPPSGDENFFSENKKMEMSYDYSGFISESRIFYQSSEEGRYKMYKMIIHSIFVLPIFLLAFILFYKKKNNFHLKLILVSFLISAFFLIFRLIGEIIEFISNTYKDIAIYVVLILLVVIFAITTYFVQIKYLKEDAED